MLRTMRSLTLLALQRGRVSIYAWVDILLYRRCTPSSHTHRSGRIKTGPLVLVPAPAPEAISGLGPRRYQSSTMLGSSRGTLIQRISEVAKAVNRTEFKAIKQKVCNMNVLYALASGPGVRAYLVW